MITCVQDQRISLIAFKDQAVITLVEGLGDGLSGKTLDINQIGVTIPARRNRVYLQVQSGELLCILKNH